MLNVLSVLSMCAGTMAICAETPIQPRRIVGLEYPRLARLANAGGRIVLRFAVSSDGKVERVDIEQGHPLLAGAASECLRKWTYQACPETGGSRCNLRIHFDFILEGLCASELCPSSFTFDFPDTVTVRSTRAKAIID